MASVFDLKIPYADLLGMRRLTEAPGNCTASMVVRPELMNSWGVAHGGAVMSLLDLTLGMSAKSLDDAAIGATTVELKVNFLATVTGEVVAEGHAQRAGRSLVFVEGEIRGQDGAILAKATGTFKLRYPRTE
jgi:uncharacterized protein (TIGR00369 family)